MKHHNMQSTVSALPAGSADAERYAFCIDEIAEITCMPTPSPGRAPLVPGYKAEAAALLEPFIADAELRSTDELEAFVAKPRHDYTLTFEAARQVIRQRKIAAVRESRNA